MKGIKSKLLISVMALALAVTMATATTFAWFSMGSVATAKGIDLEIATEGDIRISLTNANSYVDYARWGYSVNLSTSDRLLQPVTIEKDAGLPATLSNGVYKNTTATGDYALNMLLRDGSDTTTTSDAVARDYFKQDLYFASPYAYEVTMDALNVGSEDISALVDPDNASRSAASYHYVVLDNTVASGVDNTTGKLYGIEFFYNDVDNHFMVETATGKTYEITFEWTELTSTLWFTIAGDATTSRTSIASSIPAAAAGYDIDYAFNITVAGQTLAGTLQIPTGKRADTFSQAYVSFTGAPSGYTMYNASSPIAELQYRTFSGVNPVVYTNKAQITSISHGASPAFQIMVNSVQISATWPALPATGYDASQIQLVAQTSSYEVINAGDYLFAKAANAMRIALVHQTFANPDNVGAGTAKTYSGADVMIYDPYSNSGWSYYDNMNMAHEAYMGEMAGILLEPNYNATHNGVGRDAVTHTYNSTARTATGAYTNGTYTANNPTFLLKDTGVLTNGENVYGAKVSLYIWIEGTDADCMNAIAAYYILGQLSFTGAMPR